MTQSPLTEDQIAKLKADAGGATLHLLELEIGDDVFQVVCREPGAEYTAWRDVRDREDAPMSAKRLADSNFVNALRVYPSGEEWIALVKAKPGIASTFAGELAQLAGVSRAARRKKL